MLKKIHFVLVILPGILLVTETTWAKTEKASSKTMEEKVRLYYSLVGPEYAKDEAVMKKLIPLYEKYFTEADLDGLIAFYQSPLGKKSIEAADKMKKDILGDLSSDPGETSTKKKEKKKTEAKQNKDAWCESDMKYIVEDVQRGIDRFKRVCGVEKFPENLDSAFDGKADRDNLFFSRVTSRGTSYPEWSKKGSTYSYTCGGKTKSFTYKSETGTFQ